jgi:hypothetical protein
MRWLIGAQTTREMGQARLEATPQPEPQTTEEKNRMSTATLNVLPRRCGYGVGIQWTESSSRFC